MYLLPELLTPRGSFELPEGEADWPAIRSAARTRLRREVFHALDRPGITLEMKTEGLWLEGSEGERSYNAYRGAIAGMDIWVGVHTRDRDSGQVVVAVTNAEETARDMFARLHYFTEAHTLVILEPRGAGLSSVHPAMEWDMLRAGAQTGLTPVMVRIQDLQLTMPWIQALPEVQGRRVYLYGRGDSGVACLYHAVFDDTVCGVIAEDIPSTHARGSHILGILRVCDLDHAAGLLAPRPVALVNQPASRKMWANRLYQRLHCQNRYVGGTSLKAAIDKVLEIQL